MSRTHDYFVKDIDNGDSTTLNNCTADGSRVVAMMAAPVSLERGAKTRTRFCFERPVTVGPSQAEINSSPKTKDWGQPGVFDTESAHVMRQFVRYCSDNELISKFIKGSGHTLAQINDAFTDLNQTLTNCMRPIEVKKAAAPPDEDLLEKMSKAMDKTVWQAMPHPVSWKVLPNGVTIQLMNAPILDPVYDLPLKAAHDDRWKYWIEDANGRHFEPDPSWVANLVNVAYGAGKTDSPEVSVFWLEHSGFELKHHTDGTADYQRGRISVKKYTNGGKDVYAAFVLGNDHATAVSTVAVSVPGTITEDVLRQLIQIFGG